MNRARDGEYIAALLGGMFRGDEGPASRRRLDNHGAEADAADDAVALGEIGLERAHAHGEGGDDRALRDDPAHEVRVGRGKEPGQKIGKIAFQHFLPR